MHFYQLRSSRVNPPRAWHSMVKREGGLWSSDHRAEDVRTQAGVLKKLLYCIDMIFNFYNVLDGDERL